MLLKPSVMSKPGEKNHRGVENPIQSSPEFCSKLGGPDALAPTLHRTSENIRGSIRPCGSRPDFCKFFTSCFCTTAWCCHDAMRVPTTRRRQDAPASSGRRVPTTPPGIVGRGVLTMPPRVVRTSRRRHDAPHVPRRRLRFSDLRRLSPTSPWSLSTLLNYSTTPSYACACACDMHIHVQLHMCMHMHMLCMCM